jgi:hypothetical protein
MMDDKKSGKKDSREKSFEARMDAEKKMREMQNRSAMKSQKRDTRRGSRG